MHNPPHNLTAPLAYPSDGHYPAGWVSPESAEAAERIASRRADQKPGPAEGTEGE